MVVSFDICPPEAEIGEAAIIHAIQGPAARTMIEPCFQPQHELE
ncbi:hypothetical protein AB4072_14440 [Microvirga sp. 2MCAF38]